MNTVRPQPGDIDAAMSKIISLNDKLKLTESEKEAVERKRKILTVRRMFQCTQCVNRCERCGTVLGPDNQVLGEDTRIPYNFCDSCAEEYLDYVAKLQGKGDPQAYWQNHTWLRVWGAWIEYQGAVDQYLRSKEFKQIMEELRTEGCDLE